MAKIYALIVTYGNHKEQLQKVLNKTLINENVDHIFIVDNGSNYSLKDEIEQVTDEKVSLIVLSENTGSAGGFSTGIKQVVDYSQDNDDRVLILDDDSYAELDAIEKINAYERELKEKQDVVWSLNRLSVDEFPVPPKEEYDYSVEYYYNSFYRFSVTNILPRNKYKVKRKDKNIKYLVMAPYSGLLVKVSTIREVGFPIEEMYLYSDDIEYTYRISSFGYKIYQPYDANIRDIVGSWFNAKSINVHDAYFDGERNNIRALYAYRNEAYLAKRVFQRNVLLSNLNYAMWLLNLFLRRMPKSASGLKHFKEILIMTLQGRKGILGKIKK